MHCKFSSYSTLFNFVFTGKPNFLVYQRQEIPGKWNVYGDDIIMILYHIAIATIIWEKFKMDSSRQKKERCISRDSDENNPELIGKGYGNMKRREAGDRLQREHFLKPDSDQIDLNLLLDAVLDINDKLRTQEEDTSSYGRKYTDDYDSVCSKSSRKHIKATQETAKMRESRQNFSFRNEQVLAIDMENQRLLREISRSRPRSAGSTREQKFKNVLHEPVRITTSSEVNRKRFQRRIDEENQV